MCALRARYVLDIVIPVYNEERDLPGSVRRLHEFLAAEVPYPARITVADNASTDGTLEVARRLADELSDVEVIHLRRQGPRRRTADGVDDVDRRPWSPTWTSICRPI